jgi:cytidylate kinase
MHITITGDLGSGKSTVAKKLCARLGFNYLSTGIIQRKMAAKQGVDTLELNYMAEGDANIDEYIDNQVKKINHQKEPHILDSRMAWFFIKESFKVYLTVDPLIASQRVISDGKRSNEPVFENPIEKSKNLIERRTAEIKRFNKKYGVDCSAEENFDAIIDTGNLSVDEVTELIEEKYQRHLTDNSHQN